MSRGGNTHTYTHTLTHVYTHICARTHTHIHAHIHNQSGHCFCGVPCEDGADSHSLITNLPSRTCLVMVPITEPAALVATMLRVRTRSNDASSAEKVNVPPKPGSNCRKVTLCLCDTSICMFITCSCTQRSSPEQQTNACIHIWCILTLPLCKFNQCCNTANICNSTCTCKLAKVHSSVCNAQVNTFEVF